MTSRFLAMAFALVAAFAAPSARAEKATLKFLLELRGVRYKKEIEVAPGGKFEWRVSPRNSAPVHFKGMLMKPSRSPASDGPMQVRLRAIDMRGFTYFRILDKKGAVGEKKPWAFKFRDKAYKSGKLAVVVAD